MASQFYVDHVTATRNEIEFILNSAKEGFSIIVFQYGDSPELKGLLLSFFQAGQSFDFEIAPAPAGQNLGPGRCKIKSLTRVWGTRSSGA